ncbi:MAG: purine-nucleoside phosphorylase [Bacteroidales bacterium]|nr:purine-nucleoside phosphorylase [Bacteroidales bacterium]MBO7461702.1 purine-nucleoside phosphorylase [Bacteroidales bacterium]MBP5682293.1 purine-nucleoside phosphorylase [Bacteroidales bacterium]
MLQKIKETTGYIRQCVNFEPEIGIILGTGLGNLANDIEVVKTVPYKEIPNFPVSTVQGHKGQLVFGYLGGKKVVAMQGRFHYYEGYTMQQVTFPVRVMNALGIKLLIVSNASGGMNPTFKTGDIMVITDHINHFGTNPLIGPNIDELGPRFPEMSEAYDHRYIKLAFEVAEECNIHLQRGVYIGVTGPTFETPAEYRFFHIAGADAVGMSTVPEVIVARHSGLPVFALSVITDLGGGSIAEKPTHEEVQQAANAAEPRMTLIIKKMVERIKF